MEKYNISFLVRELETANDYLKNGSDIVRKYQLLSGAYSVSLHAFYILEPIMTKDDDSTLPQFRQAVLGLHAAYDRINFNLAFREIRNLIRVLKLFPPTISVEKRL